MEGKLVFLSVSVGQFQAFLFHGKSMLSFSDDEMITGREKPDSSSAK